MASLFRTPSGPFEPPTPLYHFVSRPLHFLVYYAHHLINVFRGGPGKPRLAVRVVCLSDTHTHTLSNVPDGDVLIHAGDLAVLGTAAEIQAQIDWLAALPHPHKIVICGNHDGFLDPRSRKVLGEEGKKLNWKGITYLQHSSTTLHVNVQRPSSSSSSVSSPSASAHQVSSALSSSAASISSVNSANGSVSSSTPLLARTLRVYGAPQIPACGGADNAFQYTRGADAWSDTVPVDTDILVTHTPAKWHRDLPWGQGCEHLRSEVERIQPRLHVHGHVHGGRGKEHVYWDEAEAAYVRVCELAQGWRGLLRPRAWTNAVRVLLHGALGILWNRGYGGRSDGTTVVNAGLVDWKGKQILYEPIVVDI